MNVSVCYLPLPCPRCRRTRLEADIRVTSDKAAVVMGVVCEKCGFDYNTEESKQWLKENVTIGRGSVPSWFSEITLSGTSWEAIEHELVPADDRGHLNPKLYRADGK